MTDSAYTRAAKLADQRAIDQALAPVTDALLADLHLTLAEALAMIRAGQPCPLPRDEDRTESFLPHEIEDIESDPAA